MGSQWIVHLKWQLGREEWRVFDLDNDETTIVDVMAMLIDNELDGVLPINIEIMGPAK
jgi:hypothetical protein